jgi:hypothetical protein
MAFSGVMFDYSSLLGQSDVIKLGLRHLLAQIRGAGLAIAVVSTHRQDINGRLAAEVLPPVDHLIFQAPRGQVPCGDEVFSNKGSPDWVFKAAELVGCRPHELVSIGDEHRDWTGAIGAAVLHLHAGWVRPLPTKPVQVMTFSCSTPDWVWLFLSHFLLPPSRFKFVMDLPGGTPVHFRSLFTANETSTLPATSPHSFSLVKIFAEDRAIPVKVGPFPAGKLLMVHALTSLYAEGLIDRYSRFTVYLEHSPGESNPGWTSTSRSSPITSRPTTAT